MSLCYLKTTGRRLGWLLLPAVLLFPAVPVRAISLDEMMGGLGEDKGHEEAAELIDMKTTSDFSRLDNTHLSMLDDWDGVQQRRSGNTNGPFHWKAENGFVRPLDTGAIRTLLAVPEDGKYRIFLRQQVSAKGPQPLTLTLTPQSAETSGTNAPAYKDAGAPLQHVFGSRRLPPGKNGRQLEKELPVRFEAESQLIAAPPEPALLWEYADLDLKKGVHAAALSDAQPGARAQALLLTRSPDFRPSFAAFESDKTLGRLYMRFRAIPAGGTAARFAADASLTYHWRRDEDTWGWPIGRTASTPAGEWSPFVEATDAVFNGPGPWASCWTRFEGVTNGETEVQFAWFPHEKAVVVTTRTGIGAGVAMLRVPNGDWSVQPSSSQPAWGLWSPARLKVIQTQEAILQRYFDWTDKAEAALGLKPDHPRPHKTRIFTGCGVQEPNRTRAAEMLARLGISWIDGAPQSVIQKYGLITELCTYGGHVPAKDRARVTKIKMGDEITTRSDAGAINGNAAWLRGFRDYLRRQAEREGMSLADFTGLRDESDIECLGSLPADAGRFERRLYYHSQVYSHLVTCEGYSNAVKAIEAACPNARVYNNYSPHPLFLTGTTMNESDWFVLNRHQAQTLGWGEDWATGGGWGLGTAYQCVSFYAALVDCAVRKHGYAAGFYVGSNCGGSAQKIFGCLAQGVSWLHLYDWGPIDRWAEGSNAWSDFESQYYAVMAATHAIGPADEILADGRREARRTAILYNRSHEILQGGLGRANHDWMWTFIAMKSAHIPVEVIIEEDLNPGDLKRYDVLFVGGLNLARYHVAELRKWVEAGGLLIGTAGAAGLDPYNDPLPETAELFGAAQRRARPGDTGATARIAFKASEVFPAIELNNPYGLSYFLEPKEATAFAQFADGRCAAAGRALGKGRTLLLGFQPGFAYRDNGKAYAPVKDWLAAPVLKRLGRQRVEFDWPASEATLFEHESGLAVMLADFAWPSRATNSFLSVQTDRPVKAVTSALGGPLEWKRNGDRIDIVTRPLKPVDVVILK